MKHNVRYDTRIENKDSCLYCTNCGAYLGIWKSNEQLERLRNLDCVSHEQVETAQKDYEKIALSNGQEDETPCICGYYGRACSRLKKNLSGSVRALCHSCPISKKID